MRFLQLTLLLSCHSLSYYPEIGVFILYLPSLCWMSKHQDCWLTAKFGKQLFPCLWAYLFISGCFLQESVISSPLKGCLKYACILHFEANPLIHAGFIVSVHTWIAKILIMQMCCVGCFCFFFFNDNILGQFSFTNSSFLYPTTVYRQISWAF